MATYNVRTRKKAGMCVYLCVRVCASESARVRGGGREIESLREKDSARESVCMLIRTCVCKVKRVSSYSSDRVRVVLVLDLALLDLLLFLELNVEKGVNARLA